ncbi:MAG: ATP-binding protein [Lachnospiraceae bacterium]|nr:ATP-binding protein [Lachnospiraceae bacterium]
MKKRTFPLGYDDFREVRMADRYFVDKSMMVEEFLSCGDKVSLITRPRRFGKTLNMTMLRDFFDITKDSRDIFEGLAIMDTDYAEMINSMPVIYFTLKDCNAQTPEYLARVLCEALAQEYHRYYAIAKEEQSRITNYALFEELHDKISMRKATLEELSGSVSLLEQVASELYQKPAILLWDEYDTPIMSSHQYKYHDQISDFIANFYGSALKGQQYLEKALLTGIQRVAKESIFSKLNNVIVYTTLDKDYAAYFGFTTQETKEILEYYGHTLDEGVRQMYDGYHIGGREMYNPWSILNYCKTGELRPYWVNTSSNTLIRERLKSADESFKQDFELLVQYGEVEVALNLETSYEELKNNATLWGLFVNAGYLTVKEKTGYELYIIRFVNREVKDEFKNIVAESIGSDGGNFSRMVSALARCDYEKFFYNYKNIILSCTSYYDSVQNAGQFENPYHMLTLGMMISLDSLYQIKSNNYETGDGRADIRMISKEPEKRAHIIIEFKCTEDVEAGAQDALEQIHEKRYAEGLRAQAPEGQILCLGIAHFKKKCAMRHEVV